MIPITRVAWCFAACALIPYAHAGTISFTGNLRTDANFVDCGTGCTLGPANTDGDYAQWAAVAFNFQVPVMSAMTAITFSYGGGTNGNGVTVLQGGFEPYLSLFDSNGNFLASTFAGITCPAGSLANSVSGFCYDVGLDGGTLAPGTYQIAISAFENMSFAENPGGFLLADGFTGLGNLAPGEDMHYGFDVSLAPMASTPEPGTAGLALAAVPAFYLLWKKRGKRK